MESYSEIRSLEELEKARTGIRKKLERKEDEIYDRLCNVRNTYSPTNLLNSGIQRVAMEIPFRGLLLNAVKKLKYRIERL